MPAVALGAFRFVPVLVAAFADVLAHIAEQRFCDALLHWQEQFAIAARSSELPREPEVQEAQGLGET